MTLKFPDLVLSRGRHQSPRDGLCVMEAVAWYAGEDHTDRPECACPVLAQLATKIGDACPDDLRNSELKELVPLLAESRHGSSETARAAFLKDWVGRTYVGPENHLTRALALDNDPVVIATHVGNLIVGCGAFENAMTALRGALAVTVRHDT